ncbi:MAG: heavy metal translocating P-type ATPase [Blastocatellia bacterium]
MFCCAGCLAVHALLEESGLDACESCDTPRTPVQTNRFAYLDAETTRRALLQYSDGVTARITLRLPRIHCASCIWLLEHLYKLNPAILRTEVNFLKKELAVTFREQEISLRQLVELLAKTGYEPDLRLDQLAAGQSAPANAARRRLYQQIGLAGFAFANVMIFSFPDYLDGAGALGPWFRRVFAWLSLALATPVLLYSAADYFLGAWRAITQRRISLDLPVALGMTAIYARSVHDIVTGAGTGYLDSFTGLVFFLLIGRLFQQKTFDALSFDRDYAAYFPLAVTRLDGNTESSAAVSGLRPGDRIFVRHAELVPADSALESEQALIDYSFVTGESRPVAVGHGALVYAGGRVAGAGAQLRVEKQVAHSYLTQLWNHEAFRREKHSSLTDLSGRFGRWFTVVVLIIAVAALYYWLPDWRLAMNAFTATLIIACPCALTLAAPFTLGAALTILGKAGFYLKNTGVVTDLAGLDTIVFDKTGTLTSAASADIQFAGAPLSATEQVLLAACLKHSAHPLSRQLAASLRVADTPVVSAFQEFPGHGLECLVKEQRVRIGAPGWVTPSTEPKTTAEAAAQIGLSIDGVWRGAFSLRQEYRAGLPALLATLGDGHELFLLSGDNDHQRRELQVYFPDDSHLVFHQTPADKLRFIETLQRDGRSVAMIGDGLNDAGALRQSHVGIALTENTSAFSPACDALLAAGQLARLPVFIGFARYALKVLAACFLLSLVYNIAGLTLAVTGRLSPLATAILMPVSSLSVVTLAWGGMKARERWIIG